MAATITYGTSARTIYHPCDHDWIWLGPEFPVEQCYWCEDERPRP